jgi:hypothetical protein
MPDLQRTRTSNTSTVQEGSRTHECENNGVGHSDSTTSTVALGFVIVVRDNHAELTDVSKRYVSSCVQGPRQRPRQRQCCQVQ